MKNKKVYCFSGLGADFSAFRKLNVDAELVPVEWVTPLNKETFLEYCNRIIEEQIDTSEELMFLGLSFGGVVVQTISSLIIVKHKILISTIEHEKELPLLYKIPAFIGVSNWFPEAIFNKPNWLIDFGFGITNPFQKRLLHRVIKNTNVKFAKWAIKQLLNWRCPDSLQGKVLRIHGTKDMILPSPKNNSNVIKIEGAGHLMVWSAADQVSEVINEYLERL